MKLSKFLCLLIFLIISVVNIIYPKPLHAQTILFEDNFETDRSSQWSVVRGSWIRNYISESYRFGLSLNTPSSTTEVQGGDYTWTNYEFSFDMLPISGTDRNIYFRVRPERSGSFWNMDVPVSYGLHMYSNRIWLQRWNTSSQIEPVTLPISLPNNMVTHFKIQVLDNNIKVFLDNSPLPTIDYSDQDSPILSGRIALGITTGSVYPTEVWFDNVKVVEIPDSQSKLTVIKHIENNNGGDAVAGDFMMNVTGTNVSNTSFVGSEEGTTITLDAGLYSVDENEHTGYTKVLDENCSGDIAIGETKTCIVTNDDIPPSITLTKNVINDNGGIAGPDDFEISIGEELVTSGSTTELLANTPISINEVGLAGYGFVSITGTGCPTQLGETVVLSPGQNINCVITNDDVVLPTPTPVPVTKVFMIPGLGASWNVDALINCKNSDYSGGWTLAPYAKHVYDPLLSILPSQGWTAVPFYYDWRQNVTNNTSLLTDLINSNVQEDEKIDLVGHSMGGLIGRNYLESQSGGKASKFLAVGVPNQGSALAYPAIVNKEIWTDDLVEKIASTLLFNHCGAPLSLKNLLPTYNYLRDSRTKQLKEVVEMKIKNDYLPTNFIAPFWNVKVGTLAGTGKATLKIIDVIKNPKWPDGKPINKEYVGDGDGTVLVSSAQIPDAFSNDVINQSHSGIIASDEGLDKILKFLGSPGINDPPYSEPKSALVLVGYPGNFWVTDKNGVTTQSEAGMIALMNPEDEDYELQITPTSTSTTFVVGQFLPNGQTEYKEYKFRGLVQEPKILKFDSKHPKKDILHEIKEYKKPHFPFPYFPVPHFSKFWFNFWNFFNRSHK